jgi:hypothetical protein
MSEFHRSKKKSVIVKLDFWNTLKLNRYKAKRHLLKKEMAVIFLKSDSF